MLLLFTVLVILGLVSTAEFPSFLMRCSRNDPDFDGCFERAANDAIRKLKNGVPSLGVPPLDPLIIPKIVIKNPGNGRITLDMVLENVKFSNISNSNIKTQLDFSKNMLTGQVYVPYIKMESDYSVNGKLLLFPLRGKGKANIDMYGTIADFKLKVPLKEIRGKTYYYMEDLEYRIRGAEGMKMKFTNLLGTNRALGESLNSALNENWMELYSTLSPSFSEVVKSYFYRMGRKVFLKVPADQIFPDKL